MTLTTTDKFQRTLRLLREHCPATLPVVVRRRQLPRAARYIACCELRVDRRGRPVGFVVSVSRKLRGVAAVDALLHEWAHALSYTVQHPSFRDHGPEWGIALSRCYLVVVESARPNRIAR